MKTLNPSQIVRAADELTEGIKNWKLIEQRGEFMVFRMPESKTGTPSSNEGETLRFWRFDAKHAAERFRNRQIVAELSTLLEAATA